MSNLTQEEMILKELKAAGSMGLHPTYFIRDLFVYQYNRAIHNIRKFLECECKNNVRCLANEHVVNRRMPDGTTKFFYEDDRGKWEKMRLDAIKDRDEGIHLVKNSDQPILL